MAFFKVAKPRKGEDNHQGKRTDGGSQLGRAAMLGSGPDAPSLAAAEKESATAEQQHHDNDDEQSIQVHSSPLCLLRAPVSWGSERVLDRLEEPP